MTAGTKLYQPVKKVFADLREQGCKVGIVTTKYHYRIDQILDKFGISSAVDIIVGAEDVKIEKPDPEGLLIAAGYFGVGRNMCCMSVTVRSMQRQRKTRRLILPLC